MSRHHKEVIGQKFGKLTVTHVLEVHNKNRKCRCICDCGKIIEPLINNVKKGNTTSCGCSFKVSSETSRPILYNYNINYFKTLTPDSEYILGFLYTDGNLSNVGHKITMNLQEKDRHILEEMSEKIRGIRKVIELKAAKSPSSDKMCQPQCRLQICNKHIYKDLESYGFHPKKSKTIVPHQSLKNSIHFWRGVIDGDGNVHTTLIKGKFILRISLSGNYNTLKGFLEFVTKYCNTKASVRKNDNIFNTSLVGKNAKIIMKLLYENEGMALIRKKNYLKYCYD